MNIENVMQGDLAVVNGYSKLSDKIVDKYIDYTDIAEDDAIKMIVIKLSFDCNRYEFQIITEDGRMTKWFKADDDDTLLITDYLTDTTKVVNWWDWEDYGFYTDYAA